MRKIEFYVPTWQDVKSKARSVWRRAKYDLNGGHKCSCCGRKMLFRRGSWEGTIHGQRIIVESHLPLICRHCLADRIEERVPFDKQVACDWCGHIGTESWFQSCGELAMFGSGWWNGYDICSKCVTKFLRSPEPLRHMTSYSVVTKSGEMVYPNDEGVQYTYGDLWD